ncbi:peptide/nickel transport system substrate-binding protein [Thermocatellispora tengchongensis]|uniref:Peptide/nickel transport system substrate-binding protein n=1 Tax=Thermocatellispora tengchongensis TaxID=1073253 RepID=A0A840PFC2_9ACTN|nr:ABC transporter substrate-binding protein [Thermocatellispora tengchongensis]MBB5135847.1 peptide/nickel transport system substrate-binding protein [Thermocatellispora tengchongensis]
MKKRRVAAAAVTAALAMGLAACGGTSTTGGESGQSAAPAAKAEFNAALTKVFNPSTKKGGTIKFANSGDWDSLDPADTYYGYSWNFIRLYGRALTMFKSAPGAEGATVVPDLATDLGKPSEDFKTWTYTLRDGLKFEDGTPITSKDVAYAVARSTDKETFPNGPTYLKDMLNWPKGYEGPYKSKDVDFSSAIETPDDKTIIFHLTQPYSGFDYLAQMSPTMPVPKAKDTGAKYREHVISSGPYMFEKNEIGKGFTLVRNPHWDPATDPNRPALPDRIEVQTNVNADDLDNRLMSGDIHIDVAGTGVQPAAMSKILPDPNLKAQTDNPTLQRLWYTSISPTVKPLDNIDCRKAVLYAADKTGYQSAYGGEFSGGQIATNLMPPSIPGAQPFDLYPSGPDGTGDLAKAKEHLAACGQPNGFETNIAYRAERPKEKATAEALQQSLARVGIKLTLKPYPQADYFSLYAGKPPYVVENKLGLAVNGWGSDYPDGYGFLQQITDSRVIRETGGSSNISVRIPEVDKMFDQSLQEADAKKREPIWNAIDKRVMEEAVILPGVWAKSLLFRPKGLTNVFISDSQQMYDYVALGVQ